MDGPPGVDGVTWASYGMNLEANLEDLHARVHSGAYRARPSRRAYIPKADGRQRPLGIAALEDKIVQRAVVEVLNAIYEEDFLGFSYGFRPGRSPHDALDALAVGIERKKVNWVLDADLRDFFSTLDQAWLMKFLEHRIADKRVLRLIRKWLSAGVIEDGKWSETPEGSPQGASVSPLLANVYLHYVFDRWVRQWRSRHARGDVIVVRFADDFIVGFQYQRDAERFLADLRERLAKFKLELHPEKTRLIEFGPLRRPVTGQPRASGSRRRSTSWASRTFAGRSRGGRFWLQRITISKRMRAKLHEVKNRAASSAGTGPCPSRDGGWQAWCEAISPTTPCQATSRRSRAFRDQAARHWFKALRRRSQRHRLSWTRDGPPGHPMAPACPHHASMAIHALRRSDLRQEPSAVVPHAGICAGGRPQGRSLPQSPGSVGAGGCNVPGHPTTKSAKFFVRLGHSLVRDRKVPLTWPTTDRLVGRCARTGAASWGQLVVPHGLTTGSKGTPARCPMGWDRESAGDDPGQKDQPQPDVTAKKEQGGREHAHGQQHVAVKEPPVQPIHRILLRGVAAIG